MSQEARVEITVDGQKFSKVVILTEGTYDDDSIQEQEVLEAYREVRRTVRNSSFWKQKNLPEDPMHDVEADPDTGKLLY